ncbi:pentapeptide repeat-containing protein, partial [Granulosicoccus sp.]|nr:pentapeptide repeat-containing protein [Granulosicoccus sp.]
NSNEEINLSDLDLRNLELNEIDFSNTGLSGTIFTGSRLGGANFENADLTNANLDGCQVGHGNFRNANLRGASAILTYLQASDFSNADCTSVSFQQANLGQTTLTNTKLIMADLTGANLDGADVSDLSIDGVNLHDVRNIDIAQLNDFVIDGHNISTWKFSPISKDPWSVLRRRYTGVMTTFHLILFITALGPYIPRALKSYTTVEVGYRRVEILLGFDISIAVFITSIILVSYNILRLLLTWWLSQLRDIELRTAHAPKILEYWWCWLLERYFLQWVAWVAIILSAVRTTTWLFEYV